MSTLAVVDRPLVPSPITPTVIKRLRCPYAARLEHSKWPRAEETTEWRLRGIVLHDVMARAYDYLVDESHIGRAGLPKLTDQLAGWAYQQAHLHGLPLDQAQQVVEEVVDILMDDTRFNYEHVLGVEMWLRGRMDPSLSHPDGLPVAARADLVRRVGGQDGTGVRIYDWKARPRPDNPALDNDPQAQISLIAAADMWPWAQEFEFCAVYTVGGGVARLQAKRGEVSWIKRMKTQEWEAGVKRLGLGPWPARPGVKCEGCPMRGRCAVVGGTPDPGQPAPDGIEED